MPHGVGWCTDVVQPIPHFVDSASVARYSDAELASVCVLVGNSVCDFGYEFGRELELFEFEFDFG